jgi:hypothetical protein
MAALSSVATPALPTLDSLVPSVPLVTPLVDPTATKTPEVKDVKSAKPDDKSDTKSTQSKEEVDAKDVKVSPAVKAAMERQYPIYMVHSRKSLPEIMTFLRGYAAQGQRVVSLTCVFGKGRDGYTQKPMTIVVMSPGIFTALEKDGLTEFGDQFKHYVVQPFFLRPHHIRENKADLKWAIPIPGNLGKVTSADLERAISKKIDMYSSVGLLSKTDYRVDVPLADRITGEPGKVAYVVLKDGVDIGAAAAMRLALDGSLWEKDEESIFACRWNMKKQFVKKPIIKKDTEGFANVASKKPGAKKFTKFDRKKHADK